MDDNEAMKNIIHEDIGKHLESIDNSLKKEKKPIDIKLIFMWSAVGGLMIYLIYKSFNAIL